MTKGEIVIYLNELYLPVLRVLSLYTQCVCVRGGDMKRKPHIHGVVATERSIYLCSLHKPGNESTKKDAHTHICIGVCMHVRVHVCTYNVQICE